MRDHEAVKGGPMNDCRNIPEAHRRQAERLGQQVAVRSKRGGSWQDLTWSAYRAEVLACAAALAAARGITAAPPSSVMNSRRCIIRLARRRG